MPGRLYTLTGIVNPPSTSASQATTMVGTVFGGDSQNAILQSLFNFTGKIERERLSLIRTVVEKPRCRYQNEKQQAPPSAFVVFPSASNEFPTKYAWLSVDGVSVGNIDLSKLTSGQDLFIEESLIKLELYLVSADHNIDING